MRKSILGVVVLCCFSLLQAAEIEEVVFADIARHTHSLLKEHADTILCEKNVSGFLRVSFPAASFAALGIASLEKVRLNYWPGGEKLPIEPESIHTHPRCFKSLILAGGYVHSLYGVTEKPENREVYSLYHMLKKSDHREAIFVGERGLVFVENKEVHKGDIVHFDTDLIHRVEKTEPGTLSLNVVFRGEGNCKRLKYDMFYPVGAIPTIVTNRERLEPAKSKPVLDAIGSCLATFLESNTNVE